MPPRHALHWIAALWFAAAALAYLDFSLATILRWAPHALYADQWRQYLDYFKRPFPLNILQPDNGHRPVVPNLIAWFELVRFDGNQWLQIAIGLACMLAAAGSVAWICLRDRDLPLARRAAAAFLGVFAIFWLGNVRTLFHSTELIHTSLPIACLMLACGACILATRDRGRGLAPVAAAALLGVIATLSFGYGIAVFVSILAVLVARKARPGQGGMALLGLAALAVLYFLLPGGTSVSGVLTFAPAENLLIGARWLGAPFVTLFTYLWDPHASGLLNGMLSSPAFRFATLVSNQYPDVRTSVMPYAAFGAAGMIALAWTSLQRVRATAPAGRTEALGLGIAWLGLVAAGIVSVSRLEAFARFPDQIYADRYLPWPCLFWLGLALIALSRPARNAATRGTLVFALLLPLLGWPIETGGAIFAALTRGLIDNTANGSIVGVIERGTTLGETETEEFVRGLATLQGRRIAQFATPAAAAIGSGVPATARMLPGATITIRPIDDNLIGAPGSAVVARDVPIDTVPSTPILLVDTNDIVVGLASNDARLDPPGYSGYARCSPCLGGLRAAILGP
ncbi:MAG TPA: hypothetical protein VGH81_02175 [Rudaea sp.]